MALSCNNQLDMYTGGPRQQRSRGFVTVREPALGFFITGTTIDDMNGIYVCARNDSVTHLDLKNRKLLLTYRNDNKHGWLMALVEPIEKPKPKGIASILRKRNRAMMFSDSEEEDSDDEVNALQNQKREWVLIDTTGRDRFRHDGDTIIPGAGVSWKHLHRGPAIPAEESAEEEEDWASVDSGDENRASSSKDPAPGGRSGSKSSKSGKHPATSCTAIQAKEEKEDDEDELPWQVIAILDRETVADMRYTARCYEANLREAKSGRRLPKIQALTGLDTGRLTGCWLYRVSCLAGVEVRVSPMFEAPVIGHTKHGEYVQIVEKRVVEDETWLQLKSERQDTMYRGLYLGGDNWMEERWVSLRDEDYDEAKDRLEEVDLPDLEAEPPAVEKPDAIAFDRPFEPRLADGSVEEKDDEDDEANNDAAGSSAASGGNKKSGDDAIICSSEQLDKIDFSAFRNESGAIAGLGVFGRNDDEFKVGDEVLLSGLNAEAFNNKVAIVVTAEENGRQGVKLKSDESQAVSVRLDNLRSTKEGALGPMARYAKTLGVSLANLGVIEDEDSSTVVSPAKPSGSSNDGSSPDVASTSAGSDEASAKKGSDGTLLDVVEHTPSKSTATSDEAAAAASAGTSSNTIDVTDVLKVALRAAQRDASGNAGQLSSLQAAYDGLVRCLKQKEKARGKTSTTVEVVNKSSKMKKESTSTNSTNADPSDTVSFVVSPADVLKRGNLGQRAKSAIQHCESEESIKAVIKGVQDLRTLITIAAPMCGNSPAAAGSAEEHAFGIASDDLVLRLTLIQSLLKARKETEGAREAAVAIKLYPESTAAAYWHARFSLRSAGTDDEKKQKALDLLKKVAEESPEPGLVESGGLTDELVAEGEEQEADGDAKMADASTAATAKSSTKKARSAINPNRAWAVCEAKKRVAAWKEKERGERRAMDAYSRGLFEDAVKWYEMGIKGACEFEDDKWGRAELFAARAASYRRLREFTKAIDDLDRALGLYPRYKRALFRKGVVQLDAGRPKDAIHSFETLMGLDRDWESLLDWLVRAHAQQRRGGGAAASFYNQGMFSEAKMGTWAEAAGEGDIANEKDHYAVLGVSQDATEKQLKKAYRVLSLKYHPDKEGGSTRAFQRVALAYQTLSDPEKRESYDNGADIGKEKNEENSDSDDEQKKQCLREEIERKYFPERYKFYPFGDPFVQKRKRQERMQQRQGRPAWFDQF